MAIHSVQQSGGNFSRLGTALADSAVNPGDTINIEGLWTVDDNVVAAVVDDNLTIQTLGASRHPGHYDESLNHYRLKVNSGTSHCLTLNGNFTTLLDGLAIVQAGTGISAECFRCTPNPGFVVTIRNCLMECSTNTLQQDCVYTGFNTSIGTVTVEQCDLLGAGRAGIHVQNFDSQNFDGTVNVNSSKFWNCGRFSGALGTEGEVGGGIKTAASESTSNGAGFTINCHNVVCVENDTGVGFAGVNPKDYHQMIIAGISLAAWNCSNSIDSDGSIATDTDNNGGNLASRTATDNTSPGVGEWVIVENITSSPFDLRLVDNAENDAQDMHAVLAVHGLTIPDDDIVGTSRPQNTDFDCGPFEIVAGGPPANAMPMAAHYRKLML